jgi:hypothetical protein
MVHKADEKEKMKPDRNEWAQQQHRSGTMSLKEVPRSVLIRDPGLIVLPQTDLEMCPYSAVDVAGKSRDPQI